MAGEKNKPPQRKGILDSAIADTIDDMLKSERSASGNPPPPAPEPKPKSKPKSITKKNPKGKQKPKYDPDEELSYHLRRERERIRERLPNRATYDLPPELRQKIAELAAKYGCSQSQLATLILIHGLKTIVDDQIDPAALRIPSGSPRFDHNLDLTASLAELKKLL